LSFPYVCPEPVLAKCSFIFINGSKMPFFAGVYVYNPLDKTQTYGASPIFIYYIIFILFRQKGAFLSRRCGARLCSVYLPGARVRVCGH